MCRVTSGDKLVMYEFMAIEREADAIVLWMRHYRWNLTEREAAPDPLGAGEIRQRRSDF